MLKSYEVHKLKEKMTQIALNTSSLAVMINMQVYTNYKVFGLRMILHGHKNKCQYLIFTL